MDIRTDRLMSSLLGESETTRDQLLPLGCFNICGLLGSPVTAMPLARGGRGGRQKTKRREQQKANDAY